MGIANKRIERHTIASHPSIKTGNVVKADQSEQKEKDDPEDIINKNIIKDHKDAVNEESKVQHELPLNKKLEVNKKQDMKTCPVCYKIFYSVSNMKAHVKSHHDAVGRFHCEIVIKHSVPKLVFSIILRGRIIQKVLKLHARLVMINFLILKTILCTGKLTSQFIIS